jgi:SAM-dependent methyltransferase
MRAATPTSYDDLPYASVPHRETHPDRLATVASLLGLHPPPVAACRVLELGSAVGGNLIPMALTLPQSHFVGVELSGRQVAEARRVADALKLRNIEFRACSILELDDHLGSFDYIIAHGLFSWVPPAVAEQVLRIASRCLTSNGIALVSYNTYPGWHMRGMVREMMAYDGRHTTEPLERARRARQLVEFLVRWTLPPGTPYARILGAEQELLRKTDDSYLLHEHLEEFNEPVYFHEFITRVSANGLRYLGEAEFWPMVASNFPPEVEEVLRALGTDQVKLEQYMDFLRYRPFRETLLCRQDQMPSRTLQPRDLEALHVASPVEPRGFDPSQAGLHNHAAIEFVGRKGATLSCHEPLVKAAFLSLWEIWPEAVSFVSLLQSAQKRLQAPGDDFSRNQYADFLCRYLLKLYSSAGTSLLDLHVCPPAVTRRVGARPVASPLARLQVQEGSRATNLRHELIELDEVERRLLGELDGSREWTTLAGLVGDGAPLDLGEYMERLARKGFFVLS